MEEPVMVPKTEHGIEFQGDTLTIRGVTPETREILLTVFDNGGYTVEKTNEGVLFRPTHRV